MKFQKKYSLHLYCTNKHWFCHENWKLVKKNYPQVYLEEYKYKIEKKKMIKFINTELDLNDSDNSNFELLCYDLISIFCLFNYFFLLKNFFYLLRKFFSFLKKFVLTQQIFFLLENVFYLVVYILGEMKTKLFIFLIVCG